MDDNDTWIEKIRENVGGFTHFLGKPIQTGSDDVAKDNEAWLARFDDMKVTFADKNGQPVGPDTKIQDLKSEDQKSLGIHNSFEL